MSEIKSVTADKKDPFTPLTELNTAETNYPTRDGSNNKLDVADLFTHFTASIIREDKTFTR